MHYGCKSEPAHVVLRRLSSCSAASWEDCPRQYPLLIPLQHLKLCRVCGACAYTGEGCWVSCRFSTSCLPDCTVTRGRPSLCIHLSSEFQGMGWGCGAEWGRGQEWGWGGGGMGLGSRSGDVGQEWRSHPCHKLCIHVALGSVTSTRILPPLEQNK